MALDLQSACRYGFGHLVRLMDGIKCRLPRKLRRRIILERYFHDGADVIADYDLLGRYCKASYLTPFLDENLLVDRYFCFGRARRYWYTQDGLGSVRQLVSDSGEVFNSYAYTAWGVPLNWHEKVSNRYTFTGREYTPEVGFYHFRLRIYQPELARFAQKDVYADMPDYCYVGNKPLFYTDPSGACPEGNEFRWPRKPRGRKLTLENCLEWLRYMNRILKGIFKHLRSAAEETQGKFEFWKKGKNKGKPIKHWVELLGEPKEIERRKAAGEKGVRLNRRKALWEARKVLEDCLRIFERCVKEDPRARQAYQEWMMKRDTISNIDRQLEELQKKPPKYPPPQMQIPRCPQPAPMPQPKRSPSFWKWIVGAAAGVAVGALVIILTKNPKAAVQAGMAAAVFIIGVDISPKRIEEGTGSAP